MDNQPEFDWQHFLALAHEWYANPATIQYAEALYRSISSHAYYAAYHAAEATAIQLGMEVTSSASDHKWRRKGRWRCQPERFSC